MQTKCLKTSTESRRKKSLMLWVSHSCPRCDWTKRGFKKIWGHLRMSLGGMAIVLDEYLNRWTRGYSDMTSSQQVHLTCLLRFPVYRYLYPHMKTAMTLQGCSLRRRTDRRREKGSYRSSVLKGIIWGMPPPTKENKFKCTKINNNKKTHSQ